ARRRTRNLRRKQTTKTLTKQFKKLLDSGKGTEAQALLPSIYKALDKAAARNVIRKNTASRKKSRLGRLAARKKSA
ncbi:MAG: 30S ribosomal protein S20, partial [Parcubacteria group bacterium]|nr:30S ribosomal protein S20 [Parcubacteria group bacterium]